MVLSDIINRQFELPLFGAVGLSTLAIVGVAAWFIFLRPKVRRKITEFR